MSYGYLDKLPEHARSYPSVTEVLGYWAKPGLMAWAAKQAAKTGDANAGEKIRSAAALRGSLIHEFIECSLKGLTLPDVKDEHKGYVEAAMTWLKAYEVEMVSSEEPLWSDIYKYRGQTDGVFKINKFGGKEHLLTICDFKTITDPGHLKFKPYETHRWQIAAYNNAYYERNLVEVQAEAIVRLAPDGAFGFDIWDNRHDQNKAFECFSGILNAYKYFLEYSNKKEDGYANRDSS